MSSKKVLFISHDANRAGSQLLLLQLIRLLGRQGLQTHVLLCDGGELVDDFKETTATTLLYPDKRKLPGAYLKQGMKRLPFFRRFAAQTGPTSRQKLEKVLNRHDFGLVFVNSVANAEFYQEHLPFLHHLPVVVFAHELEMSVATYTDPRCLEFLLGKCDHLIAVSQAVADFYVQTYHYPLTQVSTFTLINSDEILEKLATVEQNYLQRNFGIEPNAVVVGGCGNAEWRKGNDIFNLIAREVIGRMPAHPIYFVWVGAGPIQPFYELIKFDIERFGLTRQIILIPPTPNVLDIMNRFDIFLLSSREDPYPLVVLEAALLQKPIVCFEKAGGAPELVEEDAGEVVGYLDIEGAVRAIIQLVEDPELRKKKGQAAHRKVLRRHDTEHSVQKVLGIIESLMPSSVTEIHPTA